MSIIDSCNNGSVEQVPVHKPLLRCLLSPNHMKCLAITALIIGSSSVISWCKTATVTKSRVWHNYHSFPVKSYQSTSPCDEGFVLIPVLITVMLYLLYLIECWHCDALTDIKNKSSAGAINSYLDLLRASKPQIWWKAVCFHHAVSIRAEGHQGQSCPVAFLEKVNKHVATSYFRFDQLGARDASKKLADLTKYPIVRIELSKGFGFATLDAMNEFNRQRALFIRAHQNHDDFVELKEGLVLTNCHFHDLLIATSPSVSWFTSSAMFWIFSLLLLSWPYRLLCELMTHTLNYQIVKLFGTNEPNSENLADSQATEETNTNDYTDLMDFHHFHLWHHHHHGHHFAHSHFQPTDINCVDPRMSSISLSNSTSDTDLLDAMANCLLVPSYSEAISLKNHMTQPANDGHKSNSNPLGVALQSARRQILFRSDDGLANSQTNQGVKSRRRKRAQSLHDPLNCDHDHGNNSHNCEEEDGSIVFSTAPEPPPPPSYEEVIQQSAPGSAFISSLSATLTMPKTRSLKRSISDSFKQYLNPLKKSIGKSNQHQIYNEI